MKFNLLDIAKKVGSEIIRSVIPGGGLIISAVNALLPTDKQLSETATGDDIQQVINSLPVEQRAQLIKQQYDIDETWIKEKASTLRAAIDADIITPHTTRPKIAYGAFVVVSFLDIMTVLTWMYGVYMRDEVIIATVVNGWPFILAMTGPLTGIIFAYFGKLTREHKDRMNAATGGKLQGGFLNILTKIIGNK